MANAIVVIGVTGCGKSTLGAALADALGWAFVEGDALHPRENLDKMKAGIPLNDTDREPFLKNVAQRLVERRDEGVVASCSALKRKYRDAIREQSGGVCFVLPVLDRELLAQRLRERTGHFMPPELLASQLADFEEPQADENVVTVEGTMATADQVRHVLDALREHGILSRRAAGQQQQ